MILAVPKLLREDEENEGRGRWGVRSAKIVHRCSRGEDIGFQRWAKRPEAPGHSSPGYWENDGTAPYRKGRLLLS